MPDSINELLWWALNGTVLILLYMIKQELSAVKGELKLGRQYSSWLVSAIVAIRTRCEMMHRETPFPYLPDPPKDE